MNSDISILFSLILSLFPISLVLIDPIGSITTSPFTLKVSPVSTISTIASAAPVIGANSTDPC